MQKFSLTFLVTTLVALFVAEFSSGHPTNVSQSTNYTNIIGGISFRQPGGKICCTPILDRSDYVVTPGLGAHKIHKRRATWNEARKICLMEGAHLAVLDSTRKNNLFKEWMSQESLETLWLGFHDLFEDGSWTTVTGDSVDTMGYHPWAKGEPNNLRNGRNHGQHCAILSVHVMEAMGADDGHCDGTSPFVCEIDLCGHLNPPTVPNAESISKVS
ncbi:hemolymph lipopolysaccharide-binding protein [Megalopta genalis]|uniref:hemolymph lipopolysaccharide-binding protein n=1 Tax=Megalopta genalis TaxID=115081 RepID=UPI0014433800|nr:hemolymph lipopolysaccharide-binding protein-like [Megalopta genalis]